MTTCGQTPTGTWVITTSDNTTANSGYNAGPYVLGPVGPIGHPGPSGSLEPNPVLLKLLENDQIFTREVMADILQAARKYILDQRPDNPPNDRVIGELFENDGEVLGYFMSLYGLTGIIKHLKNPTLPLILTLATADSNIMGMVDMTDWKPGECVKLKELMPYGPIGPIGDVGPIGPYGISGPSWIDPNNTIGVTTDSSSNFITYSIKNATVVNTT